MSKSTKYNSRTELASNQCENQKKQPVQYSYLFEVKTIHSLLSLYETGQYKLCFVPKSVA